MNPQIGCCSLVWLPVPLPRHWYVTMSTGWWHLQELVRFHRHKWRKPHYIICQLAIGLHSPRKRCHCRSNIYYILGRESHFYLTPNKIISNKRISLHICSIWSQVTIKLQNKQYGYSDFFLNGPVLKGLKFRSMWIAELLKSCSKKGFIGALWYICYKQEIAITIVLIIIEPWSSTINIAIGLIYLQKT